MKKSAGVAIIYQNKILLCHPTNAKWQNSYSIPKGEMEPGESFYETAIRETFEETGIRVTRDMFEKAIYKIDYNRITNGKHKKEVYYFVCRINDLKEIGLNSEVVPKSQLQLDEVDWAGFVDKNQAPKRVAYVMKEIVRHLNESENFNVPPLSDFV